MTDCSQLQALLDDAKQERQALDDPETYCQDQCDPGDVGCIKVLFSFLGLFLMVTGQFKTIKDPLI